MIDKLKKLDTDEEFLLEGLEYLGVEQGYDSRDSLEKYFISYVENGTHYSEEITRSEFLVLEMVFSLYKEKINELLGKSNA
jgi:hypothetical protein